MAVCSSVFTACSSRFRRQRRELRFRRQRRELRFRRQRRELRFRRQRRDRRFQIVLRRQSRQNLLDPIHATFEMIQSLFLPLSVHGPLHLMMAAG
jgi:hypothetical protein